jgi:hypothetical protein
MHCLVSARPLKQHCTLAGIHAALHAGLGCAVSMRADAGQRAPQIRRTGRLLRFMTRYRWLGLWWLSFSRGPAVARRRRDGERAARHTCLSRMRLRRPPRLADAGSYTNLVDGSANEGIGIADRRPLGPGRSRRHRCSLEQVMAYKHLYGSESQISSETDSLSH